MRKSIDERRELSSPALGISACVSFPFADQSACRKRPTVVVGARPCNAGWPEFIIRVTSRGRRRAASGSICCPRDWQDRTSSWWAINPGFIRATEVDIEGGRPQRQSNGDNERIPGARVARMRESEKLCGEPAAGGAAGKRPQRGFLDRWLRSNAVADARVAASVDRRHQRADRRRSHAPAHAISKNLGTCVSGK